jgi:uncharacterized repeat protein (TIGR01451 family)
MKTISRFTLAIILFALVICTAHGQQHRAVHLGHPATRFAPPLSEPAQLRTLLTTTKYRADVIEILRQAGWSGRIQDLTNAAATASIDELSLPRGTRMPFMSSRKDGRPVALMDVLWDGSEPISAYAFEFISTARRYRCITPKPCSNFFVIDLGPALPALALDCNAPNHVVIGQKFEVCLVLINNGIGSEPMASLSLPIPAETSLVDASVPGSNSQGKVVWKLADLQPGASQKICATFAALKPASVLFDTALKAQIAPEAQTHCVTRIEGIPAILLETADLDDPIEVGKEVVYEIKVTNQGSSSGTNLKLTCTLPDSEQFLSATGPTEASADNLNVTMATLPELAPKAVAVWRVTVKALRPDDARFKAFISSDQFQPPIQKDEATHLY